MSTENIGEKLHRLREEKNLPLRRVATMIHIEAAILNKMERGERQLTKEIIKKLAEIYKYNAEELLVLFSNTKVLYEIGDEEVAFKTLQVSEERMAYKADGMSNKSDIINRIKSVLKNDGRVVAAWLFGSTVKGTARADSDVDIMVELNKNKNYSFFDLLDIAYRIEKIIGKKVDLVEKGYLKDFALSTAQHNWKKIYG